MKTKHSLVPTPSELTFDQFQERFSSDDLAREYLEQIRWPAGAVCPHCKNADPKRIWKIEANKDSKVRAGLYQCGECNKQFTVTVGTIFEDSHIPLRKWLMAWWMVCSSKKGVSSLQLQRMLGLGSYRTALFMTHRIRHALRDPAFTTKLTGTVEVDETYVGGKTRRGIGGRGSERKTPVMALVERDGNIRSRTLTNVTGRTLHRAILDTVQRDATIMTDDFRSYHGIGYAFAGGHKIICHKKHQYSINGVSTNTVESFFAILKRGIHGTFHSVSKKHLPLYLAEFDHRWNHRKTTDAERTVAALQKAEGKRLIYKRAE